MLDSGPAEDKDRKATRVIQCDMLRWVITSPHFKRTRRMAPHLADGDVLTMRAAWQDHLLKYGISREPTAPGQSVVLWLPTERDWDFQYWERISTVPHTEFVVEPGILATTATSVRAKQPIRSGWRYIWRYFHNRAEGRSWTLPNGKMAEQCSERRNDRLLVWCEGKEPFLNESWIKSRWPTSNVVRCLGRNLFLVSGFCPPILPMDVTEARSWLALLGLD
jgi:hypothetical protein